MKKKKEDESMETKTKDAHPVVTQVVEVVGEDANTPGALVENATPAKGFADENLEEMSAVAGISENADEEETFQRNPMYAVGNPQEARSAHQREKETVAELFTKPVSPMMSEIAMHTERRSKKTLWLWMLGIIGVTSLIGGAIVLLGKQSIPSLSIVPSPTPTIAATPTPTPPPPDRKDITIQILNGGGVPGAASKMKKLLEEKGYTIKNVSNADEYIYEKTEVHVKTDKAAYNQLLLDDLKDTYVIASDASALSDDVSYDAQIIVGKE